MDYKRDMRLSLLCKNKVFPTHSVLEGVALNNLIFLVAVVLLMTGCAKKVEKVEIAPEVIPFRPEAAGIIEGLVYETNAKTPISGVMVVAYDRYGYATGYDETDMHGRYTISGLPFGQYILQIRSGEYYGTAQRYAGEYYRDAHQWQSAALFPVKSRKPTLSANFLLEKGGALCGKVIDASQKVPIPYTPFFLKAYTGKNSYVTYISQTDSLGEYLVTGLEPGIYKIKIEPEGWVGGFYGGTEIWDSAWVVESLLDTVTLRDFETIQGGAISGKVSTTHRVAPTEGVEIAVQVIGKNKALEKRPDSTGYYIISGLPDGNYLVRLSPTKESSYAYLYYPDAITPYEATTVKVVQGDTVTGIDFELSQGGVISGVVKDDEGNSIEEFDIDVYPTVGATQWVTPISGREIRYSAGKYEIRGLPPGEYILRISSFSARRLKSYANEYYKSATHFKDATPIKVKSGYNTSGINFNLEPAGWVQGFIFLNDELLSSEDVKFRVVAFNLGTREVRISQNTFVGGYRVSGLRPGEYKLCAVGEEGFAAVWIGGGRQFDDPKTEVIKIEEGKPTNVDFSVTTGECQISGKIYDALTKSPISGEVLAYDSTGHILQIAQSNEEGYKLKGLAPGRYFVRTFVGAVREPPLHYRDKWYKDCDLPEPDCIDTAPWVVKIPSLACSVELKEGELVRGIDFWLESK